MENDWAHYRCGVGGPEAHASSTSLTVTCNTFSSLSIGDLLHSALKLSSGPQQYGKLHLRKQRGC